MSVELEGIKTRVTELADLLNAFKSEAVQLRLLEALLQAGVLENVKAVPTPKPQTRVRRAAKKEKSGTPARTTGRVGGMAMLADLITGGFFGQKRKIGDIVDHCEHNLARKYKQTDFSGPLARAVRDAKLTRSKDADGQYEYKAK